MKSNVRNTWFKISQKMKIDGEMAMRRMSEMAQQYYYGQDVETLLEYDTDDGKRYDIIIYGGKDLTDLKFEEAEKRFEEMYDEEQRLIKELDFDEDNYE